VSTLGLPHQHWESGSNVGLMRSSLGLPLSSLGLQCGRGGPSQCGRQGPSQHSRVDIAEGLEVGVACSGHVKVASLCGGVVVRATGSERAQGLNTGTGDPK